MANNLKELTKELHHSAERKAFAKILLSGKITPQLYHRYLYNQFHAYQSLESKIDFTGIESIIRYEKIRVDINELEKLYNITNTTPICESTKEYIRYVQTIDDQDRLVSHMYVRHFGDMYGGNIIKNRVPGSGSMYNFIDVDNLKLIVREKLTDDMAEEAKICFTFAIRLFEELMQDE